MRPLRLKVRLRPLDEAEAYARCHGDRGPEVRIVHMEPRRARYDLGVSGEDLRQSFERRLDARETVPGARCSQVVSVGGRMTSPASTHVGWIGTGVMGSSMCGHVLAAGYGVTVYSRTKERAASLLDQGATWADSPAQVGEAADIVCLIVGYPADVREVVLGPNGVLGALASGSLLVDLTTSEPSLAVEIHEEAQRGGVGALDAPVSGGDVGARNATLSIMVGGDEADVERARPLLEVLGQTIVHQGGPGAGQHTKMVNQTLIATGMIGVCEALLYGYKAGLDLETCAGVGGERRGGLVVALELRPADAVRRLRTRDSSSTTSSRTWASRSPRRSACSCPSRVSPWRSSSTLRCRRRAKVVSARTRSCSPWHRCRASTGLRRSPEVLAAADLFADLASLQWEGAPRTGAREQPGLDEEGTEEHDPYHRPGDEERARRRHGLRYRHGGLPGFRSWRRG